MQEKPLSTLNETSAPSEKSHLEQLSINTIRFLSADGVQQANSGHPGLPMGTTPMAYTIWTRHLRHNPANPAWANRDRFILSGGHGCMMLYSLLYLTGYDLPLDELKRFRQWGRASATAWAWPWPRKLSLSSSWLPCASSSAAMR